MYVSWESFGMFFSFYMIVYNEGEFCSDNCLLVLIICYLLFICSPVPDILQVSDIYSSKLELFMCEDNHDQCTVCILLAVGHFIPVAGRIKQNPVVWKML